MRHDSAWRRSFFDRRKSARNTSTEIEKSLTFGWRDALPIGELLASQFGPSVLNFRPGQAIPGSVRDFGEIVDDHGVGGEKGCGFRRAVEWARVDRAGLRQSKGGGMLAAFLAEGRVGLAQQDACNGGFGVATPFDGSDGSRNSVGASPSPRAPRLNTATFQPSGFFTQ